jgi:hypothetical protein
MEMNGQPNAERERERERERRRAGWKIIEAVLSQCSILKQKPIYGYGYEETTPYR